MKKILVAVIILGLALSAPEKIYAQKTSSPGLFEKMKAKKAEREAKRKRQAAYDEFQREYNARKNRHLQMQDEKTRNRMLQNQKRDQKEALRRDHSWWDRMKMRL